MTKKKKTSTEETVPDDVPEFPEEGSESKTKQVFLKQYLVIGSKNIYDRDAERKAAFIMHTCAKNAREEFKEKFGMDVASCTQTAESTMTKDDMDGADFWKDGTNWELECEKQEPTESAKRYFRLKEEAEFVQAEKKRLGIDDWKTAAPEQIDAIRASTSEWEKSHSL